MKLVIDNRTGYLSDYYFQTLCLLYFPGEKFRQNDTSVNSAYFYLDESNTENHNITAKVVLSSGEKSAEGTKKSAAATTCQMKSC